jgi:hypothetical protein
MEWILYVWGAAKVAVTGKAAGAACAAMAANIAAIAGDKAAVCVLTMAV